ncbi:hypothetical protein RhiirC2_713801 [Rhizophagus irregularis]|uniref:Uncharacterized protein n=1 Tax=Rhizophagus irregularis TaxID=588596 RepID=A0A2N1N1X1_9GLOM|nr:hypothetical protein RhiirC2_713801 [Rhizophagus irregularis]
MDLDEEFDNCDELFDFSDTEMCAEQTDDKEYNDLSDNTAGVVEEGLDLIESLNTLKIDKSDCSFTSVIKYGDSVEGMKRSDNTNDINEVRSIIDKDNIEISVDPTNGEIYNSNMILATVSVHENFCNLEAMDAVYE